MEITINVGQEMQPPVASLLDYTMTMVATAGAIVSNSQKTEAQRWREEADMKRLQQE